MNALVFAPLRNTPGKRDASGAFLPEARAFCKLQGLQSGVQTFDNALPMAGRRAQVTTVIRAQAPASIDTVALFGHGWRNGIQHGFRSRDVPSLARALARVCTPTPRIILYCCDTARDDDSDRRDDIALGPAGEGGFAHRLRNALSECGAAATVFAHATLGHTTINAWTRRFDALSRAGGDWIIPPRSELWPHWVRALRTNFRFQFPFLTQAEIELSLHSQTSGAVR